jgi:hypothetical protein
MTTYTTSAGGAFLLVCLYLVEAGALALALLLHRQGDRPLRAFAAAPAGLLCGAVLLTLTAVVATLVYGVRGLPPPRTRRLVVPLVLNLCSVLLVFGVAETVVRVLATSTIQGPVVAGTVLLPHRWADVAARSRATLDKAVVEGTYLVHDRELGWTNGPNRQSRDYNREGVERYLAEIGHPPPRRSADDNIYLSSAEGLRSPRVGMSFSALPTKRRIAAVGDSFTFGLEVPYEETWTHRLEQALGGQVQVLNFGVDGYGVDQAYLRYRRDVLAWHPEIVILGIIDDDLRRTMCVYGFLCFPGFGMPFAKPRLVLAEAGGLTPLNLPLPAREELFAKRSITDLPFVEFDAAYQPAEWRWRFYHRSYAARFLLSRYPAFSTPRRPVTAEAQRALNAEIVRAFVRLARERGSIPIVVYFPTRAWEAAPRWSVAKATLDANRIRYLDMTGCVGAVSPAERFIALHYSARTNAAVAGCLRDAIAAGFESSDEAGAQKTPSPTAAGPARAPGPGGWTAPARGSRGASGR